jgi:hypothetical protein
MKTRFLKRIVSSVARSFAEGMVMADPLVYGGYLRCMAEAEERAAPRDQERVSRSETEVIAA